MKITKQQLIKIIKEELALTVPVMHQLPVDNDDELDKSDSTEIGMAVNQLQAISATALELSEMIKELEHVPEWGDGKIATVLDRLNSVRSYMLGKMIGQGE